MTNANDIPKDIQQVPFSTLPCENRGVRLGLVVLETDLTIETEMRYFLGRSDDSKEPISLIHTRIGCDYRDTKKSVNDIVSRFKRSVSVLKKKYSASFMLDDAHGLGVIGDGTGSNSLFKKKPDIDIYLGME